MSEQSPEWRGPSEEHDDAWILDFEKIEGEARLYIKKTTLKEYDREAYAVLLYDTVTGNEIPVDIDFNPAEAENLIEDWISREAIDSVQNRIQKMRNESIVESEDTLGGKPRIKGTRVSVEQIREMHDQNNKTPEQIAEILPSVTVQDVKSAIKYSKGESQ